VASARSAGGQPPQGGQGPSVSSETRLKRMCRAEARRLLGYI
jgi:hypothetical protein